MDPSPPLVPGGGKLQVRESWENKNIDLSECFKGLEETKTALRNSQIFLDEINYGAAEAGKTLPKMENLRETSVDDLPELTTNNYPYLSHSTYSLPRNHRWMIRVKT